MPRRFRARAAVCAASLLAAAGPVFAGHSGGVGACGGCHAMHDATPGAVDLLHKPNPTDVCLGCHQTAFGNTWGRDALLPGPQYGGGQFIFLRENNIYDGSENRIVEGRSSGHSVISIDNGTAPDVDYNFAPGGTVYPSNNLHCTSCHDPHGRGGHFRMLWGAGPVLVNGQSYQFTYAAPEATGIDVEGPPESRTNHTSYRRGLAEWCANCHTSYLQEHGFGNGSNFEHEVNEPLGAEIAALYNAYNGTGQPPTTPDAAYIPEVPVETTTGSIASQGGVDATSRVTCVSCHRAHGSSAPHAGRWDFDITTWAEEGVRSGTYKIPNPYPSAGLAQRRLCDKCHGDGPPPPAPMIEPPPAP